MNPGLSEPNKKLTLIWLLCVTSRIPGPQSFTQPILALAIMATTLLDQLRTLSAVDCDTLDVEGETPYLGGERV